MSEPDASVVVPAASDAAEPPDEPPGVYSRFHGLRVTPQSREWVTAAQENSGAVVRACTMAPARISRSIVNEVTVSTLSLWIREPDVVRSPLIAASSLTASGTPSSARTRPSVFP